MPRRACNICKGFQEVSSAEWKLINFAGEFVCSQKCILGWIKQRQFSPSEGLAILDQAVQLKQVADRAVSFRSQYEYHFAKWLSGQGIDWHYETWGFTVGETKTYTPDFYLPLYSAFMEVKGQWGLGQKKKMEMFKLEYPNVPILVVPWTVRAEFYPE